MLLLGILSIRSNTNDAVLRDLRLHSEALQQQLDQYSVIGDKYATKFYYEIYETELFGGISKKVGCFIWLINDFSDTPFSLLKNTLRLFRERAMQNRLVFTKTMWG